MIICLDGLLHVIKTQVARHGDRTISVEIQIEEICGPAYCQCRMQPTMPHRRSIHCFEVGIIEVEIKGVCTFLQTFKVYLKWL